MNYQTQSTSFTSNLNDPTISKTVLSTVNKFIESPTIKIDKYNYNFKSKLVTESKELSIQKELLNKREIEISSLKMELKNQISSFKVKKAELEDEYISRVEDLRNIVLGVTSNEEVNIQDLRILVFGNSTLDKNTIYNLFNERFKQTHGKSLNKKCINADYLLYDDVSKSNINIKIINDKYDYIIIGQHAHSIKGKNSRHSYSRYIKDNDLKAEVFEQHNIPLNRRAIEAYADVIINKWEEKLEVI